MPRSGGGVTARDNNETSEIATEVLRNAAASAERGIAVARRLSNDGSCYRPHL